MKDYSCELFEKSSIEGMEDDKDGSHLNRNSLFQRKIEKW